MKKSLTITDIANALNLSRNTVSKALNGKYVPPKTKQLVFNTAIQMGYKSYDIISNGKPSSGQRKILILSSVPLISANYYIYLIRGIMAEAERNSLEVLQYIFRPNSNFETLKDYILQFDVNGIICIEFFNKKSASEILSLNIPTVFLDFYCGEFPINSEFDIVLPESITTLHSVCDNLIHNGIKSFAFIGNPYNCKSFYERYLGMRISLLESDIAPYEEFSYLKQPTFNYSCNDFIKLFSHCSSLPDCFVCANDFIALNVIEALKQLKLLHLDKINIIGYDNVPESRLNSPKLSTINIDKQLLGKQAVCALLERIAEPTKQTRTITLNSNFINRETSLQYRFSPQ